MRAKQKTTLFLAACALLVAVGTVATAPTRRDGVSPLARRSRSLLIEVPGVYPVFGFLPYDPASLSSWLPWRPRALDFTANDGAVVGEFTAQKSGYTGLSVSGVASVDVAAGGGGGGGGDQAAVDADAAALEAESIDVDRFIDPSGGGGGGGVVPGSAVNGGIGTPEDLVGAGFGVGGGVGGVGAGVGADVGLGGGIGAAGVGGIGGGVGGGVGGGGFGK